MRLLGLTTIDNSRVKQSEVVLQPSVLLHRVKETQDVQEEVDDVQVEVDGG